MNPGKFGLYDYKLSPEQEDRALRIHEEGIIIDLLFQGPLSPFSFPKPYEDSLNKRFGELMTSAPNAYRPAVQKAVFRDATSGKLPEFKQCWYDSGVTAGPRQIYLDSLELMVKSLGWVQLEFDKFDWLVKALCADDIVKAKQEGKKAGIVMAQNTIGLGTDLDLLDSLYDFGLRILQLSYNTQTQVAAGCYERTGAGVTNFGVKFIERMNSLKIMVDTGHCSDQTVFDAVKISRVPIICSHTSAAAIYPHKRAKSDEALKAIADCGGVIGIYGMPTFLSDDPRSVTMDTVLDQIDYMVNLCGVDHVGIGTDWPMSEPLDTLIFMRDVYGPKKGFKPEDCPTDETVDGLSEYTQFINFTRGLVSRGYSEEDCKKLLGTNWLNIFREVCG